MKKLPSLSLHNFRQLNITTRNTSKGQRMNIMIVDDADSIRALGKLYLRNLGISSIVEAVDGVEAMEKLKNSMPIDIILLDWKMPRMDGIRFLERVKKVPQYKNIKVIMCTGKIGKDEVMKAIQSGADGYIAKPLTKDILKEKISFSKDAQYVSISFD